MPLDIDAKMKDTNNGMTKGFARTVANAVKRSAQLFNLVFA
jgi:hypothetical protein